MPQGRYLTPRGIVSLAIALMLLAVAIVAACTGDPVAFQRLLMALAVLAGVVAGVALGVAGLLCLLARWTGNAS